MKYKPGTIRVLCFLVFLSIFNRAQAQNDSKIHLQGNIKNGKTNELLEFATVSLKNDSSQFYAISDLKGVFSVKKIPAGIYTLKISFIGYTTLYQKLSVIRDTTLTFFLQPDNITLQDIVVTASESRGITSSSKIDRKAMELLQPSSFTDILSLLPGGMSKDPALGGVNQIRLRETGISSTDYDVSSLGTSFLIDGVPLSTDANMQRIIGAYQSDHDYYRNSMGKGVDTRTISTDFIESVEIIRGIPSVEYGELTSGLVKIKRKSGVQPWEARFKADPGSKLIYLGKGFKTKNNWNINFGIDYLNAKIDPRDNLENYERLTASLRAGRNWNKLIWNLSLDYGKSIDKAKSDPDISTKKIDKYKSGYNRMAISNTLNWNFEDTRIKALLLAIALDYSRDVIRQTKFVSLDKDTPIPDNTEEGVHDGIFLPYQYTASLKVDGQPINAYAKAMAEFGLDIENISNQIKMGADWSMNKNLGQGQVYDLTRPLYPSMKTRPRPYINIPAEHLLSFFIEDAMAIRVGHQQLDIVGGVRALSPLNLTNEYSVKGKIYLDPRVNALWKFPTLLVFGQRLNIQLAGGIGWNTKMPTLSQIYPEIYYIDLTQLNYYHTNEAYRRLNMLTYKIDPTNYHLKPARNKKWETRLDFDHGKNKFSITYFQEKMTSGFRNTSFARTFQYKKYDASFIDHTNLQGPPELSSLPFAMDTTIYTFGQTTNGSMIIKQGIEFQYTSARIESIRTRITIDGAWFKSTYKNSQPIYRRLSKTLNDKELQYVGLYANDDGYTREAFSTKFMFDTYLQPLGLNFATSVQCMWMASQLNQSKNIIPIKYIGKDGIERDYAEADQADSERRYLTLSNTVSPKTKDPISVNVNFKAVKSFNNKIKLALFVNNILDYNPDQTTNNLTIRRFVTPYFGMELNLNL